MFMSFQFSKCRSTDLFPSSNWETERFLKSVYFILYTEQEKCSYKPLLKEKIHDLMQDFPVDTESH